MKSFILIGAGGFGREIVWLAARQAEPFRAIGVCDDAPDKQSGRFGDLPLLGTIETAAAGIPSPTCFHCAIGDNRARQALTERALAVGWTPLTLIDPSAAVAPDALIGDGCLIAPGAMVSTATRLGDGVLVNHGASVGHDSTIGNFGQLCPGARVSGGCRLGTGTFLGSNAVVIPGRTLGDWSRVGAVAVALRDLAEGETIVRLPGR